MSISEKIQAINNKVEQNKVWYDLDKKVLRFLLYCQKVLINTNFQLEKMFYQKKGLLKKATTMKRFDWIFTYKQRIKNTNWCCKDTISKLDYAFELDQIIKKEKQTLDNYSKSDQIYNSNYDFYKYYSVSKIFDNLSL